jgi:ABC-type glycerol-3-phosphate transport system substrate-binding protein
MTAGMFMVMVSSVLLFSYIPPGGNQFAQPANRDVVPQKPSLFSNDGFSQEIPYGTKLLQFQREKYADYIGDDLIIQGQDFTVSSGNVEKRTELEVPAVVTDGRDSWIEWEFSVSESAMYQIEIGYLPLPGKHSGVERSFTIDGERPFAEASRVVFPRIWKGTMDLSFDNQGNQMRSSQKEIMAWQVKPLEHPEGLYKRPYKFYLKKGKHKLRINDGREPMAISHIVVKQPLTLPSYEEVLSEYKRFGYQNSSVPLLKMQSENPVRKSEMSIRAEWIDDPLTEPQALRNIRYNTFGGGRWKRGGQSAVWEFEVPVDGLYKIGFRYATPSHNTVIRRTIMIDEKIPFVEMEEYAFPHIKGWRSEPLKNENNEPYLFYLAKGKHTITMVSKVGPLRQTVFQIEDIVKELGLLSRQIVQVTASTKDAGGRLTSDRYQDWNLEKHIPNLVERLTIIKEAMKQFEEAVVKANGGRSPSFTSAFTSTAHLIEGMIENPEKIPYQLNELGNRQSSLGQAMISIQQQPLFLDYMLVSSAEEKYPRSATTYWENIVANLHKFIWSFSLDASKVGNVYSEGEAVEDPVLTVWMARGREWVEIFKEMLDDDFTPGTGIRVNVNTIPLNTEHLLLLAYTAGKAPDVALGVGPQVPVEFAIRNALVNLNTFTDVKAVTSRFIPESLIPFRYLNGLYAIPETQDFQMLFYRKDILESLGLEPPQTWKDVYALLPVLQEHGMEFYYPGGVPGYDPFLFQHGGDFYTSDGLRSGLDHSEALAAFEEWTDIFNNYKLPLQADFYQRFRTGEMPVGIGNYDLYVKLATSAPELNGRWKMAPLPGIRKNNGVIDRSSGGSGQTGIILGSTKYPKEAWELLKWWTSEDVQIRYGMEVEGLLGVGSRWNTANVNAMEGMAWSRDEINAIMEQWSWFKEQPIVLGGYYTPRHLMNAWNKVVLLGENTRISLEDAVKEINKELLRKQEEFGITSEERMEGADRK